MNAESINIDKVTFANEKMNNSPERYYNPGLCSLKNID